MSPHRAPRENSLHRGYFGVAVHQPKTETNVGTLWRSATAFGAAFLATVGRRYQRQASDTPHSPVHTPLYHYTDLDDLLTHLPWSCPLVGVELAEQAVPLTEYWHPMRALYLLGAEADGLSPQVLARCHQVVRIPSATAFSLNVATAGTIIMYDRFTQAAEDQAASRPPLNPVTIWPNRIGSSG